MKSAFVSIFLLSLAVGSSHAVELVRSGQALASINVPKNASATVNHAATEMQKYIHLATGATLPIQTAGQNQDQLLPNIIRLGYGADTTKMGKFDYVIKAENNMLTIAGQDVSLENFVAADLVGHGFVRQAIGTLLGVYDFLDQELQVRFLWPGELGTHVPRQSDLQFAPFTRHGRQRLNFALFRMSTSNPLGWASQENRTDFLEQSALWLIRHGFVAPDVVRGGHAFRDYWQKYGETNPDFFALLPDGSRRPLEGNPTGNFISMCVSNPAFHDKIVENYTVSKGSVISIAENDVPGLCQCERCRAWDTAAKKEEFAQHPYWSGKLMPTSGTRFQVLRAEEGGTVDAHFASVTDRYARFYNAVHAKLQAINPAVRVCAQAYANFQSAPIEVKLHPNIYIGYVGWPSFPYTTDKIAAARVEFDAWRQSGASITTRPNVTHVGANMPLWFARKIGHIYRQDLHSGIKGIDFDSLLGEYATQGPSYYMLARLTNRPELTVEEILDEYFNAFGGAANEVRQYFAHWEQVADEVTQEQWEKWNQEAGRMSHLSWQNGAHLMFTPNVMQKGKMLLEKAEQTANDLQSKQRVNFLSIGLKNAEMTLAALDARRKYDAEETTQNKEIWLETIKKLSDFRKQHENQYISDVGQRWRQEFYYSKLYPKK